MTIPNTVSSLEEDAFKTAGGKIPVQKLSEFAGVYLENVIKNKDNNTDLILQTNKRISGDSYFDENTPECKGLWTYSDLNKFLPTLKSQGQKSLALVIFLC